MSRLLALGAALFLGGCASQTFYDANGVKRFQSYGDLYGNLVITPNKLVITEPRGPLPVERIYDRKTGFLISETPIYPGVHNDRANRLMKKVSGDVVKVAAGAATAVATLGVVAPVFP